MQEVSGTINVLRIRKVSKIERFVGKQGILSNNEGLKISEGFVQFRVILAWELERGLEK